MYPTVEIKKKEIFKKNNALKVQTEKSKLKSKNTNNIEFNSHHYPQNAFKNKTNESEQLKDEIQKQDEFNNRVLAQINSCNPTSKNFGSKSFIETEEKNRESKDQMPLEMPFRKHIVFEAKQINKQQIKQISFSNHEGLKQSEQEEASNFNQSEFSPILRQNANIFHQNTFSQNKNEKDDQNQNEKEMLQQLELKQAVEICLPIELINRNTVRQQMLKNFILKQRTQNNHFKVQLDEQMGFLQGTKMNIQEINNFTLKQSNPQRKPKSQGQAHRANTYFKSRKISNKHNSPRFKESYLQSQNNDDMVINQKQIENEIQQNIYDQNQSIIQRQSVKQAKDITSGREQEQSKFSRQSENGITEKIQTPDGVEQNCTDDNFQNFQNSRLQYSRVQFQKQILIKNTEKIDTLQAFKQINEQKEKNQTIEMNDPRIVQNPSDEKFLIVKVSEFQINLPRSKENIPYSVSNSDLQNSNLNSERINSFVKKQKYAFNEGVKSSSSTNRNKPIKKINLQSSKDRQQIDLKNQTNHENIVTNQTDDEGNLVLNLLPKTANNEKNKQNENQQKNQNISTQNNQKHQVLSNDKIKDLFESQMSFGVSVEKSPTSQFTHQNVNWKLSKQFQNRIKKANKLQNSKIYPELFQLLNQEKSSIMKYSKNLTLNQEFESNQFSLQQQENSLQFDSVELNQDNLNQQNLIKGRNKINAITYQDQSKISREQISITNNDQIKTEFLITTRKNTNQKNADSKLLSDQNKEFTNKNQVSRLNNQKSNDKKDVVQKKVKIDSISSLYTQKINQMQIQEQDENTFPSNNLISGLLDPEITLEEQQAFQSNINTQVKKVESVVERNSIQLSEYKKNDKISDLQKSRSQQYSNGDEGEDGIQSMLSLQKMKITASTDKNNSVQQNSQTQINPLQKNNKKNLKRFKRQSVSPYEKKEKRVNIANLINLSPNEVVNNHILMHDHISQRDPQSCSQENRILNSKKNSTVEQQNNQNKKQSRNTDLQIPQQKKPIKNWYFVSSLLQKQKTSEKQQNIQNQQKSDYNSDTDGQASANNNMIQEIPQFLHIKKSIKLQKPIKQNENKTIQDQAQNLQNDQISFQNGFYQIQNAPWSAKNFEQQKNDCDQMMRSFMVNSEEKKNGEKYENREGLQERAARTAQISHRKRNTMQQPLPLYATMQMESTEDNQSYQFRDSTQMQMPPNYLPSSNFSKSMLQNQDKTINANFNNDNYYLLHVNNIQLKNPDHNDNISEFQNQNLNRNIVKSLKYQKNIFPNHKLYFQNQQAILKKFLRNQKFKNFTAKQQGNIQQNEIQDNENLEQIAQIQNQKEEILKNLFIMNQNLLRKQNSSETYKPKYQNNGKKQQNMSYAENAEKNNLKYKTRYKNSDLEKEWINDKKNLMKLFMNNNRIKIQDRDRMIKPKVSKGLQVSFQSLQDNTILQEQMSKRQLSSNNEQRLSQMKNRKNLPDNQSGMAEIIYSKQTSTHVPSINTTIVHQNEFTFQDQFNQHGQLINFNGFPNIQLKYDDRKFLNISNQINSVNIENQILEATNSTQREKRHQLQIASMFEQDFFKRQKQKNEELMSMQKTLETQQISSQISHQLKIIQEKESCVDTEIISSQYLTNRDQNKKQFDNFSLIQQTLKTSTNQSFCISKNDQKIESNEIKENDNKQNIQEQQLTAKKDQKIKQNGYNDYYNYMKKNKNKQNKLSKLKESIIDTKQEVNEKIIINRKKEILRNQINFALDGIIPKDRDYQQGNKVIVFAQSGLGFQNSKQVSNLDMKNIYMKSSVYSPQILQQRMERIDTENTILIKKERLRS